MDDDERMVGRPLPIAGKYKNIRAKKPHADVERRAREAALMAYLSVKEEDAAYSEELTDALERADEAMWNATHKDDSDE